MLKHGLITLFTLLITAMPVQAFDLQGHRGARGLLPENTIPAFAKALSIGVSTLELDTSVTSDGIVIVSHNRSLDEALTRNADGQWITESIPFKDQTFEQLQQYDVGKLNPSSRAAQRFPDQQSIDGTRIPSLQQVFDLVKKSGNTKVRFNIETKINPLAPEETVSPENFAKALLKVVEQNQMQDRVSIQSFDWRTLQLVQQANQAIETVYLSAQQRWLDNVKSEGGKASAWTGGFNLSDYQGDVAKMILAAGGKVWSPFYGDLKPELVKSAQALGLKVIPWTVNKEEHMNLLIDAGVDGIITDYPDRLRAVMKARNLQLPQATPVSP